MDRQFSEDEAREVFARAAERQQADAARGQGLSLDELREIGALTDQPLEVGEVLPDDVQQ